MKLRKYIAIMSVLVIGAFAFFPNGRAENKVVDPRTLPVFPTSAQYVVDVNNPEAQIGFADYVFIASVVSYDDTVFHELQEVNKNGINRVYPGMPTTIYTIEIIENIKGNLMVDIPISMGKRGGVSYDQTYVELYENDSLLEVGKTYLILANGQKDGTLVSAGPNTTIALETNETRNVTTTSLYEEYKTVAVEVEDYPRQRFASIYEAAEVAAEEPVESVLE